MAKTSDGLSKLIKQLSSMKVDGLSVTALLNPTASSATASGKPVSPKDTKALSMNGKDSSTGILFGSPSSLRTSSASTSNSWTNLLTQTASGGLSSALGGGLGLAGLGGLVTGLLSLFGGGKSTPPPLVQFQLPESQQETVYAGSGGSTSYQGTTVVPPSASPGGSGIYASGVPRAPRPVALQYQSSQLAQAVKNAVLNSSSLNDVIAEI